MTRCVSTVKRPGGTRGRKSAFHSVVVSHVYGRDYSDNDYKTTTNDNGSQRGQSDPPTDSGESPTYRTTSILTLAFICCIISLFSLLLSSLCFRINNPLPLLFLSSFLRSVRLMYCTYIRLHHRAKKNIKQMNSK